MKLFYLFFFLIAFVSCQSDDLFHEEFQSSETTLTTRSDENSESMPAQHVTSRNIGGVIVGEKIINSFTVKNMRDAFMTLYWRRPINPTDGRINDILGELLGMSAYDINYTHYYVKISPIDLEEVELIKDDGTLFLSPVPFDRKISGTGTLPQKDADYDPAADKIKISGPVEPYYAIIPITDSIPENMNYEILDYLYIPYMIDNKLSAAANTPILSYTFCDLLVEQAEYLSGAKTMEELFSEKRWYPSGKIQVYDDLVRDYVGVPSTKVHIFNSYGYEWVYTDKDGYFKTERAMKGPVTYVVDWSTRDYVIKNSAGHSAYYYAGSNMTYPLNLKIDKGEIRGIATIARAISTHYYGTNDWERISDFRNTASPFTNPFHIFYRHNYNKDFKGVFQRNFTKRIVIHGKDSLNKDNTSIVLINTAFHELGHAAMFYRCKKNNMNYNNFHKVIKESWGKFCGWYMTRTEYRALGCEPYLRERKYADGQPVIFDSPDEYNAQEMNLLSHKNDELMKYYTPLFIDLIDDSNQKEYYKIKNPSSQEIYPDDRIAITNFGILYYCIAGARNTPQLKSRLMEFAEPLGTTEKEINDYFAFYEQ